MKSSSTVFVERDAAVLVDAHQWVLNRQWFDPGNSFANPAKTDFALFWPSHFCLPIMCGIFPVFLGLLLDLLSHR